MARGRSKPTQPGRSRLTQQESREAALVAARDILIEQGPQAVTLKAIAARIDRTHANLLHHFGSARGLQAALAQNLGERITGKISEAVRSVRRGETDPRALIDLAFDAYSKEGAGPLSSWMVVSGDIDALAPILRAIRSMVDQLADPDHPAVARITLALTLAALGDALLGREIAAELDLPRDTAREIALQQLMSMAGPNYGRRRDDLPQPRRASNGD